MIGPNGPCETYAYGTELNPPYPLSLAVDLPPCPPSTPAPTQVKTPAPTANPTTVAEKFWQTIPLPKPNPQIPPGFAITGKPAYLVTNGDLHPVPYSEQTPLGQLVITADGSYRVDWGDPVGIWDGPFTVEGDPWPTGQITHTYDVAGTYTVTVEEDWTATWTLGAARGVLRGLHTEAVIPGYRVEQLQAIITS